MNELVSIANRLKNSEIRQIVDDRLEEFISVGKNEKETFKELIFCILAAGTSAELAIKTVEHLGDTIFFGSEKNIQKKLKEIYRFHTIRAPYIYNARNSFKKIDLNHSEVRNNLIKNIKGIGLKEASHFLRNIGKFDYAIIDFHIVNLLTDFGLIEKPKTVTQKKYFEIEDILKELAQKTNTTLGELDLYLWYKKTGNVLK